MKFSGADNENPFVTLVYPMGDHPNHYFISIPPMPVMGHSISVVRKAGFGIRSFLNLSSLMS